MSPPRTRCSRACSATCSVAHSSTITTKADAVLIVGTYVFPEVFPELEHVFAPEREGRPHRPERLRDRQELPGHLGLVADPKPTLAGLATALEQRLSPAQKQAAKTRIGASAAANKATLDRAARARPRAARCYTDARRPLYGGAGEAGPAGRRSSSTRR